MKIVNVLLTGANGRIASHMLAKLNNHHVYLHDINHTVDMSIKYDLIIHLAATTSIEECESNPMLAIKNNIVETLSVVEIAKINQCPIIFTSTAAVYEDGGGVKENSKLNPQSIYGYTKMVSENIIINSGVRYSILRLFNVVMFDGVGNSLISSLLKCIQHKSIFKLYGDGSKTRDFVDVSYLIDVVKYMIKNDCFNNQIYNIGSGKEISIKDAIQAICNKFNYDIKIEYLEDKAKEIVGIYANMDKTTQDIPIKPRGLLESLNML